MDSRVSRRTLITGASALAAAAGLGTLSGCSAGSGSEPLQFWQFYSPAPQQQGDIVAQNKWFMDAISLWNKRNEQQVRPVYIPAYTDPTNTRLATAFASGEGPDIFLISPGDFLRYYNGGVLLDLAPYMTKEAIDDFYPQALATRRVGDGIYGLPMEVEPLALIYSEAAFEKAGLSEADVPTTWDQMLDVAEKLTTNTQSGLILETGASYFQNFTFYPWVWQGGGDVVDVKTQTMTADSPAMIGALELWGETVRSGVAPRTLPAGGDLPSAFTAGYAGMWQNGIWQIAALKNNAPDVKWGAAPLPQPLGGTASTALGGWAWVVNKNGRNPEAAAKFVVESVGSMQQESIQRIADWCWGAKSDMSPRKSSEKLMADAGAFEDPHMKTFKEDILPNGRGEPRFPPVVYKTISNAIQAVQLGGGSAADQAAAAQSALVAYQQTYEGATLV